MTGVTTIYVTGQHDVFVFVFVLFVVSVGGPWLPPLLMEWRVRHSPPHPHRTLGWQKGALGRERRTVSPPWTYLELETLGRQSSLSPPG